jgi:molecular chaperone DnaK
LKVNAYLAMTGQEYQNVFNPSERHVLLDKLRVEVRDLLRDAHRELIRLESSERYELAARVKKIEDELTDLNTRLRTLRDTDLGDQKYQIEEQKRRLAQSLDLSLQNTRIESVKTDYFDVKRTLEYYLAKESNTAYKARFDALIAHERTLLDEGDSGMIRLKIKEMESLAWEMKQRDPQYVASLYHYYALLPDDNYEDSRRAVQLKEMGEKALGRQNYDEVLSVVYNLYAILKKENKDEGGGFVGLG